LSKIGESKRTRTISYIYKSQSYLKKLTLYNNINYIFGNSFLFIGCIILLNNKDYFLNETKSLFMLIANTLKWMSLSFNILIYYYLNDKYRKIYIRLFKKFFDNLFSIKSFLLIFSVLISYLQVYLIFFY
jgi:hypothetical protein